MSVRWVDTGIVQVGPLCSAQGAIQQVGNTGVALGTMVGFTPMQFFGLIVLIKTLRP